MFDWLKEGKKQHKIITQFQPNIILNSKSTLYVQAEPKIPHSASNIVVTAFISQSNRTVVPIRVEWKRFKIKTEEQHTLQRIPHLFGNTYLCEPSDVGSYIQATIKCLDETIRGQAQLTIGPIMIDPLLKRIIDGALYCGDLLSQVTIINRGQKINVKLNINPSQMVFIEQTFSDKLVKYYSLSQPKIQLSVKDPTKIYLRFEQDIDNSVQIWLNKIFDLQNNSTSNSNISNVSMKVPYSSHLGSTSNKPKVFNQYQSQDSRKRLKNRLQIIFINRNSRDLFLFTKRAFICREQLKNELIMQKVQKMSNIKNEQQFHKFLQFYSLKYEIYRLGQISFELQNDRNKKVKQLQQMQQSINQMTMTYLKIIQQKGKNYNIDFQQSYSEISLRRQQILGRKNLRELKIENQQLKNRIHQLNQQLELHKFFGGGVNQQQKNQSMFNQSHNQNPFQRIKQQQPSIINNNTNNNNNSKMLEISKSFRKVVEQNSRLKEVIDSKNNNNSILDKRQNEQLLQLVCSNKDISQSRINQKMNNNNNNRMKLNNVSMFQKKQQVSNIYNINNESILSKLSDLNSSSSYIAQQNNKSIYSQTALIMLNDKLNQINNYNIQLDMQNKKLIKQKNHYKSLYQQLQYQLKNKQYSQSINIEIQEKIECLENQNNKLIKKIKSLTKETLKCENTNIIEKKYDQLNRENIRLNNQNYKLNKEIQNKRIINTNKSQQKQQQQQQQQYIKNQNIKLKKINKQLLDEIKNYKIIIDNKKNQEIKNSRIIQLENQNQYFKSLQYNVQNNNNNNNNNNNVLLKQNNQLIKINCKIQRQNHDLLAKLNQQTIVLQKLMNQSKSIHIYEDLEKYKKINKQLQSQITMLKRNTDVLSRSRDVSMDMDGYYEQKIQLLKTQMESLYSENQNLSRMCQKYAKDAREANKELNKWKQKAFQATKCKLQIQ